jgi:hypothetical protein
VSRRAAILGVALSLVFCASASASTVIVAPAGTPYQGWVSASHMPTPNLTVTVNVLSGNAGALGYGGASEMWLEPIAGKGTFFHELGHIFDWNFDAAAQARFDALLQNRPAWVTTADGGLAGGDEWFADAYSVCSRVPKIKPHWVVSLGSGMLSGQKLIRVCRAMKGVA